MKIAVEGCAHGRLQDIYDTIISLEKKNDFKIDLLICCGDFQSTRNYQDLETMAVPNCYKQIGSFPHYYSGEKVAPVLTIFIGGNHEASNYLQELPYGGWVAPNIYYMGYSGIINIAGIRIGAISGIYKNHDYLRGRFEIPPYDMSSMRSVYHVRNLDVFRLKQVKEPIDIFFSHDWPLGIYKHGDAELLVKLKPFFEEEVKNDKLGSPANQELLSKLKPKYWFSGHLHVKFAAIVPHINENDDLVGETKFLALDKCLPHRQFLQVFDIEHDQNKEISIDYDLEWLSILHYTNHLISIEHSNNYLPGPGSQERWLFTPTDSEKEFVLKKMNGDLKVPLNFGQTVECSMKKMKVQQKVSPLINHQTSRLCELLGIDDPVRLIMEKKDFRPIISETSENFESSTFIESDLSCSGSDIEKSPKSDESPTKRSSLVLPPPKFEESENLDETSESPIVADDKLFIIDDGSKRDNEEPQSLQNKRFKRRNHSLYANNE